MSLLYRLDSVVLEWHQGLIDALQRQPLWFARVCFFALAAVIAFRAIAEDRTGFPLALDSILLSALWLDCRSEAFLATIGMVRWVRYFGLVVVALDVVLAMLVPSPVIGWSMLVSVLLTAFFYFAACRPPKPPVPRGRLSLGGAS